MKCNQETCDKEATKVVYWPDKNLAPTYCDVCAARAKAILAIMGYSVVVNNLDKE
jgi:hypothetical protein